MSFGFNVRFLLTVPCTENDSDLLWCLNATSCWNSLADSSSSVNSSGSDFSLASFTVICLTGGALGFSATELIDRDPNKSSDSADAHRSATNVGILTSHRD